MHGSKVDLEYNLPLAEVVHDSKVDWLELNETGTKLLYRDRRTRLVLVDVGTLNKHTLDQSCGFVSWVPGSDVVVAQSRKTLRIWYNLDTPEISVDIEVKKVPKIHFMNIIFSQHVKNRIPNENADCS